VAYERVKPTYKGISNTRYIIPPTLC